MDAAEKRHAEANSISIDVKPPFKVMPEATRKPMTAARPDIRLLTGLAISK